MYPVSIPYISETVPLVDLQRTFPNPIDLRAALHRTPNGDLYRKICVRDLTRAGQIREAYLFAKEIENFSERDTEFKGLLPSCVLHDDRDLLNDLFDTCSPYFREIYRFMTSVLYLEKGNIPRYYEILLTVCEIALNEFLILSGHAKLPHPDNAHLVGKIIEAYLLDRQTAYSIHLLKNICPKLNPNAQVEDLLYAAGIFLLANDRYNDLQLIIHELTTRKIELLNHIISTLLNQGDILTAIGLAKNLPDSDSILIMIGNALFARGSYYQIPQVLNGMGSRRNELIDAVIIPLLDSGHQEIALNIVHALDRDAQALVQNINVYLSRKVGGN